MILIFSSIIAAFSFIYWLISQYTRNDILLVCYLFAVIFICTLYFLFERRKRLKLIRRATELFDGKYDGVTNDNELSALERIVVRSQKNAAAQEKKVAESYKNIAALVSDISHQCKTPLTSVLMYSELTPSEQNLTAIHMQAEKLSFLLDAQTKLSRCEGGLINKNMHPCENAVGTLAINAVNAVIFAAESKHIEITSDVPDCLIAKFDMRWTGEALFNLLDNAVKYSPAVSLISISARNYDMFVCIDIRDSGIGIPETELTNIWKRFYRAETVPDGNGVGIGLYLARLIITSEGGRISVKSTVGEGSTFSVYRPR